MVDTALTRIVIVDDEPFTRMCVAKYIDWNSIGAQIVSSYKSGMECLEHIEMDAPEIIITDIRMPCMSGLELMQSVRESYDSVQFIVISGYKDFEYAKSAMDYGALGYVVKPLDTEELLNLAARGVQIVRELKLRNKLFPENTIYYSMIYGDRILSPQASARHDLFYCVAAVDLSELMPEDRAERCAALAQQEGFFLYHDYTKTHIDLLILRTDTPEALLVRISYLRNTVFPMLAGKLQFSRIVSDLDSLSAEIFEIREKNVMSGKNITAKSEPDIFDEAYQYICQHFSDTNLTVANIAALFHLTTSYFSTAFSKKKGMTVIGCISQKRLEYAKHELRTTTKSIEQIAMDAGFMNPTYFYRLFKKEIGKTPTEYRTISSANNLKK